MDVFVLLFEDFETLDAMGPVSVLGDIEEWRMRYISLKGDTASSAQSVRVETEPLSVVKKPYILLVPGGVGTRTLVNDGQFISALRSLANQSEYCLTVCTGSALLAKTGLLSGLSATSNKRAFSWVSSVDETVGWQRCARWTSDGKYYTSSGVSAGIDMALGFIEDLFGREKAEEIAAAVEYVWIRDRAQDPFAEKTGD